MITNYGLVFSMDREFKILAVWSRTLTKETLYKFGKRFHSELKNQYKHYGTMGFESLHEMNTFLTEHT